MVAEEASVLLSIVPPVTSYYSGLSQLSLEELLQPSLEGLLEVVSLPTVLLILRLELYLCSLQLDCRYWILSVDYHCYWTCLWNPCTYLCLLQAEYHYWTLSVDHQRCWTVSVDCSRYWTLSVEYWYYLTLSVDFQRCWILPVDYLPHCTLSVCYWCYWIFSVDYLYYHGPTYPSQSGCQR